VTGAIYIHIYPTSYFKLNSANSVVYSIKLYFAHPFTRSAGVGVIGEKPHLLIPKHFMDVGLRIHMN
jgi:hypothetical protein